VILSKKQRRCHTKCEKQKQYHMSNIKYPDLATTWIWPSSNGRVPGSGTWRKSLPAPPLVVSLKAVVTCQYKIAHRDATHGVNQCTQHQQHTNATDQWRAGNHSQRCHSISNTTWHSLTYPHGVWHYSLTHLRCNY